MFIYLGVLCTDVAYRIYFNIRKLITKLVTLLNKKFKDAYQHKITDISIIRPAYI